MTMPPKKPMTRRGYQRLAEEHRKILEEERPKIVQGVADAAAEGDRSENAEYIYGRKKLREIDKKLRYLTELIDGVNIIDPEFIRSERVEFGAKVTIQDDKGHRKSWTIVGVGEADVAEATISWQSPLARALFGKKAGDYVEIEKPSGAIDGYEILAVTYVAIV